MNVIHDYIGSTIRVTWVNSGVIYSPISSALFDCNSTLVHSVAQTSSGNGFFYADHPLNVGSRQYMVNEQIGVTNANTYRRYQIVDAKDVGT